MKKLIRFFLYILAGLMSILLILAFLLWQKSPGTPEPIIDKMGNPLAGSISTIEKIKLGGIDQYLIIRGADSIKPVMLFLHGGPGSPELAFMKETNTAIENDFVMVYWEQRGAGKSYSSDIPAESMNLEQFISDTRDLSKMLAQRFKKEKIFLMGHSWGSFLGIQAAHKYPELYYAYFGIGQVCHQYRGEQISFAWIKEQASLQKDSSAIKKLAIMAFPDSLAPVNDWMTFLMPQRNYVTKYGGGVTHEMKSMWPVLKMVIDAQEYTFSEKIMAMKASLFSLETLWPVVINTNLFNEIDSMALPVYIFQGKNDYQTPHGLAREFYDQLKAPEKGFFSFENSAHSPMMEEVEEFNRIVREKTLLVN
jgi:pimeloyl-ACP methyl ester carboxylesterase